MTIQRCVLRWQACCRHMDTAPKPSIRLRDFSPGASTCKATCLVVDIQLGDIQVLNWLIKLAADGFTYPIIFITGLDDEVVRNQAAAAAGGVAFLRKPFPAQTLFDAIKKASG